MLYSRSHIFTFRENPNDADVVSHQLMIRAGIMHKTGAGLYSWMPLGKRVLDKTIAIMKEELDKVGSIEILPPFVTPGELWKETGRWEAMGPGMLRFKDRHDNDYVLGPTHEEAFFNIFRDTAHSYQNLPITLYQINTKFRDEVRPRYGVIRGREFIMEDSYSFDIDEAGMEQSYQLQREAYINIFTRSGLTFDIVLADSGAIGGDNSEEFVVPSSIGEATIAHCSCGYVANVERASSVYEKQEPQVEGPAMEKFHTPNIKKLEEMSNFIDCTTKDLIKSFIVEADGELVMACIRGDLQVNEVKLQNILGAISMEMADPERIFNELNGPIGFLGNLKSCPIKVIADESILGMKNTIIGANEIDMHYKNVSLERDCRVDQIGSFHLTEEGHACIQCGKPLEVYKGIEVGHIFKYDEKYSKAMGVTVLDKNNKAVYPKGGCYGIGVGRVIASVIEQNADKDGIVFPISIAPYTVIITPTSVTGEIFTTAQEVYKTLQDEKIEVILDDRDERPGVKMKDADLIGIPFRITIGKTWQEKQELEIKIRKTGEIIFIKKSKLLPTLLKLIKSGN